MSDFLDVAIWFAGYEPARWPTDAELQTAAALYSASIYKNQMYDGSSPIMPYDVATEDVGPLRWQLVGARAAGMPILPYTSVAYSCGDGTYTPDQFLAEVRRVMNLLGANGVYVDGMTYTHTGEGWTEDKDANRYIAKALRRMVGLNGLLIGHFTHKVWAGEWWTPDPAVELEFDLVLLGEDSALSNGSVREDYLSEQIAPREALGQRLAMVSSGIHVVSSLTEPNSLNAIGMVLYDEQTGYDDGTYALYNAVVAQRES